MNRIALWPAAALAGLAALAPASAAEIEIVSTTTIAVPLGTTGHSFGANGVSSDGRYAVFFSGARNLVAGDTNHAADLFLYDHENTSLERVNLGNGNVQANAPAEFSAGVSDDARYVAFQSAATNLVAIETHGVSQIYLRDRIAQTTTLVSRHSDGSAGESAAFQPQMSADGRYIAFVSSDALVGNDSNGAVDVYRYDRVSDSLDLVSVSSSGEAGNSGSSGPRISADGRYVAFVTEANNLFAGDTNLAADIVLRDTVANTNVNASIKPDGSQFPGYREAALGNALSADGRYLLFNTDQPLEPADNNLSTDGFRFDRTTGLVERVTRGPGGALLADGATAQALSADGNRMLMESTSGGIVGGTTSDSRRSYVRDLTNGAITHVKLRAGVIIDDDQTHDCDLSGDGSTVYCDSYDRNLTDLDENWFRDFFRSAVGADGGQRVSRPLPDPVAAANGDSFGLVAGASEDGRFVAFESLASNLVVGDFNGLTDIFLRDRLTGTTQRISRTGSGGEATCHSSAPQITPDGRYVLFVSCGALMSPVTGSTLQLYRYDRINDHLMMINPGIGDLPCNAHCRSGSISDDGQWVAFISTATNLHGSPPSSGGVFFHRIPAGPTLLVNRASDGGMANGHVARAAISGDGGRIYFSDSSSNLVAGDTNGVADVFAYALDGATLQRVSLDASGAQLPAASFFKDVSRDGRHVLFGTKEFVCPPPQEGLHVRDIVSGQTDCVSVDGVTNAVYSGLGYDAAISADGSRVAFTHYGSALVVHDRATQRIGRITPPDANGQVWLLDICAGGDCAIFRSDADNLVDDDANGQITDVFIATPLVDNTIFADDFETQ